MCCRHRQVVPTDAHTQGRRGTGRGPRGDEHRAVWGGEWVEWAVGVGDISSICSKTVAA